MKPRIRLQLFDPVPHGRWVCESPDCIVTGASPVVAYLMWLALRAHARGEGCY